MKSVLDEFDNLKRLVDMLAAQFGENTEVVLLDHVNREYHNAVVAIANGHITGRKVGDGGTNLGLEAIRNAKENANDVYNYFTKTADGRTLRSSTQYLRNEKNEPIGTLCINTDITDFIALQDNLQTLTLYTPERHINEVFASSVNDLTDHFIKEAGNLVDKPGTEMTREEKMKILSYLDTKGFFLITKSGDIACEYLDISKYTLYKYLNEIREGNNH